MLQNFSGILTIARFDLQTPAFGPLPDRARPSCPEFQPCQVLQDQEVQRQYAGALSLVILKQTPFSANRRRSGYATEVHCILEGAACALQGSYVFKGYRLERLRKRESFVKRTESAWCFWFMVIFLAQLVFFSCLLVGLRALFLSILVYGQLAGPVCAFH